MWATQNGTYKGQTYFIRNESYDNVLISVGPRLEGIAVGNGCTGNSIGVCGGETLKYDTQYFMMTALMPESLKSSMLI